LHYDAALAPTGLRSTQRSILMQISRTPSIGVGDLANHMVLERSALTHNLGPLERDGFVSIKVDPEDRRGRMVDLTPAGVNKLKESKRYWLKAQREFERAFGRQRARALRQTLALIADPMSLGVTRTTLR
jgi:DNA-binding MarR family transcriptional regulator